MSATKLILRGCDFTEYRNNLYCKDGKISYSSGELLEVPADGKYIIPGYIDRHTHGGYGIDYMDADPEGNEVVFKKLAKEGITTVIPTTMTMNYERIEQGLNCLKEYSGDGIKADLVHLEGPFISLEKIGAQNPNYVKQPDIEFVDKLKKQVKLISYAPELDADFKFIDYLQANDICGSIVHSNASAQLIEQAYNHGLNSFSHFYNGSSGYTHHNPGVVNAGLALNEVKLELICDGFHIDPYVVKQTYEQKGINSIVLITDSMRAKGMADGEYELGGQPVVLAEGQVRLASGSLAGSVLEMDQAVRNFIKFTGCSVAEAIFAASINVANSLNLSHVGSLELGNWFDVVILDEDLQVVQTYVNGKLIYNR